MAPDRPSLVLASRSPQRRAILELLGLRFEVRTADVEEIEQGDPSEVALANARRKAEAVPGDLVLGADTVVALDDRLLGKPRDAEQAADFLRALSGRTHLVVSGIALAAGPGHVRTGTAVTAVTFRTLEELEVAWYVEAGEWRERAGAYAIQGRGGTLVRALEGDYLNVVGLPVSTLLELAPELRPGL